jgi:hypothetical protein
VTKPDLWETPEVESGPPVDVSDPDLWSTAETSPPEPPPATSPPEPPPPAAAEPEPAPELGPDELAAWELLISSPIPSEYDDEPAATANGADDSAAPPPDREGTPDLWAEDLPITPSSEPGSGDEWLRLLWSEDMPLPAEGEGPEKPSSEESSPESEPGERT